MGVISNSDGTVGKLLEELDLAQYFESVTDSHVCGCEKPSPQIFQIALNTLKVNPEQAIYIGDVYSVDFLGARGVGMSALLMDAAGVYAATKYPRVASLEQVAHYLEQAAAQ
jgi:putative hydrolase of the HAD superfamily